MADPNGRQFFQISCSKSVLDHLRKLQRQATRRGQGSEFLSAFRRIMTGIRKDARAYGEPLYRLPSLRLQVRSVVVAPLAIDFAVSEGLPLVYIKTGTLLS